MASFDSGGVEATIDEPHRRSANHHEITQLSKKHFDSGFSEFRKPKANKQLTQASNQMIAGSSIGVNGASEATLDEPFYPLPNYHDIITFSGEKSNSYFTEFFDLYKKGLSLNDISLKTNQAVSTIRTVLINGGVTMRTNKKANGKTIKDSDRTLTGQIPYGYCVIEGELITDPREQKTIQKILELWQKGMAFIAIKRWLNDKKIPSKLGRQWNDKTVAAIIRRHSKTIKQEVL